MGFISLYKNEETTKKTVNNIIKLKWEKLYQWDLEKAFPNLGSITIHRYLLIQKEKGFVLSFNNVYKHLRNEIIIKGIRYVYYPDFFVVFPFGALYYDYKYHGNRNIIYFMAKKAMKYPVRLLSYSDVIIMKKIEKGIKNVEFRHEDTFLVNDFDLFK